MADGNNGQRRFPPWFTGVVASTLSAGVIGIYIQIGQRAVQKDRQDRIIQRVEKLERELKELHDDHVGHLLNKEVHETALRAHMRLIESMQRDIQRLEAKRP